MPDQCAITAVPPSPAAGIHRDQDAVTAGLSLPYSSGAMEGNVNKIKMIKRQMYGRAGFPSCANT